MGAPNAPAAATDTARPPNSIDLVAEIDRIVTGTIDRIPQVHRDDPDAITLSMVADNSDDVPELRKQVRVRVTEPKCVVP